MELVKLIGGAVTLSSSVIPKGAYNASTIYIAGEAVSYNGQSYVAIQPTTGNLPTNTIYWMLLAQKGTDGEIGYDGADGDSAYEVALNNGFVGTEAEWLLSLKGADGDGADIAIPALTENTSVASTDGLLIEKAGTNLKTTLYDIQQIFEATSQIEEDAIYADHPNFPIQVIRTDLIDTTDTEAPVISAFVIPATEATLAIPITTFTASDNVAVSGYAITLTNVAPTTGWTSTPPTTYTVSAPGTYTLYAWAKDGAGNVSLSSSDSCTIADSFLPTVTEFVIPATGTALEVSVTTFTATDSTGVTGYIITESATKPLSGDAGWSGTPQTTFTVSSEGLHTLYAYAKDASGNVSNGVSDQITITLPDTVAPTVTAFTCSPTSDSLDISITTFTATDAVGVTGYLITESATPPLAGDAGWAGTAPTTYHVTTEGIKTLYGYAKDLGGNVSTGVSDTCTVTLGDTTAPTVTAFTIPDTAYSKTVDITTFTATDDTGVTGYMVKEVSTPPSSGDAGWSGSAPATFAFLSKGLQTAYAFAKDAAGNIATALSDTVTITLAPTTVTSLSATAGDTQVVLNWTKPVAGADSDLATNYDVIWATDSGFTSPTTISNIGDVATYTHTGRTNDTIYYYKIVAKNVAGSVQSMSINATPASVGNLLEGLLAYLKFDNASGNVPDSAGTGVIGVNSPQHAGVKLSNVTFGSGLINNSGIFVGTGAYISLENGAGSIPNQATGTLSVFIKPTSAGGCIFYNRPNTAASFAGMFQVALSSTGQLSALVSNGTSWVINTNSGANVVPLNVWSEITWEWGSFGHIFRLNNSTTLISSATVMPIFNNVAGELMIGAGHDAINTPGAFFIGEMDILGVWNRVLTAPEKAAKYNSGIGNQW